MEFRVILWIEGDLFQIEAHVRAVVAAMENLPRFLDAAVHLVYLDKPPPYRSPHRTSTGEQVPQGVWLAFDKLSSATGRMLASRLAARVERPVRTIAIAAEAGRWDVDIDDGVVAADGGWSPSVPSIADELRIDWSRVCTSRDDLLDHVLEEAFERLPVDYEPDLWRWQLHRTSGS